MGGGGGKVSSYKKLINVLGILVLYKKNFLNSVAPLHASSFLTLYTT